jgi:hypothetical protein
MLLLTSLVFISGQQGCESNTAQKTGIDFSLINRQDTLQAGKTLQLGETFYVGVRVENYDKIDRNVEVCIQDTVLDYYNGITDSESCQQQYIPAAETIKQEASNSFSQGKEELIPGTKEVFFPQQGQFSYKGLSKQNQLFRSDLIVTLRYPETTRATAAVYVPNIEQPALVQDPSQIMAYMQKSIYPQGDAYNVNLDLTFVKNPYSEIFLQDFVTGNKTYFDVKMASQSLECRTTNGLPVGNTLEIKNTKTIRCSKTVYQGAQRQDYDFVLTMIYGVVLQKEYSFSINTAQEV